MRPWYHYEQPESHLSFRLRWTSTVKTIIAVTCTAYLVEVIIGAASPGGRGWVDYYLGYNLRTFLRGMFWQPFTYLLVHGGLFHLLGNMLGLFFFGGDVEGRLGRRDFVLFYLACGLGGAVLGSFYTEPMVGASAAVFGVLIAFAIYFPDARMVLFPLMIPIRARYLALFWVFMEVVLSLSGSGRIAYLAHLGGIAVAVAWIYGQPVWRRFGTVVVRSHSLRERRRGRREAGDQEEMDRILAKVHQEGIHSLSSGERRFLQKMSRQLRQ